MGGHTALWMSPVVTVTENDKYRYKMWIILEFFGFSATTGFA